MTTQAEPPPPPTRLEPRPECHTGLPPGQRKVTGFPRFGTHLHRPPPEVPAAPSIEVTGPVNLSLTLPELEQLPQVEREEDFHCVAGWSATELRWGGVQFATFYRELIEPRVTREPAGTITHVTFRGLDGYRSVVHLVDALASNVLIATQLNGQPLTPDHGAPVRLVSPSQYGFVSTKHLCAIELHRGKPRLDHPFSLLTREHPRARVWSEERHAWIPGRVIRPVFGALIRPIMWLCQRGRR